MFSHIKADDGYTDTLETLINIACGALELFKGSEIAEKRKILKMIFQNLQLKGCRLVYTLHSPFDIFEKTTTRTGWRAVVNDFGTNIDITIIINPMLKSLHL